MTLSFKHKVFTASRSDFRVTAKIDRLEVMIFTLRETQFRYIKKELDRITHGNCFAKPRDKTVDTGQNATTFTIWFHDELANDPMGLLAVIDELSRKFPFKAPHVLSAIEPAIDFYFKGERENLKHQTLAMTYRLQTSLSAPSATKPRQFDPSIRDNRYLEGHGAEGARLQPKLNFRIGNKLDDISWQVYFKITDQNQQPISDPSKWCARIETTIQGLVLQGLGLHSLVELHHFDFKKLVPFFKFSRPIDPLKQANGDPFKFEAICANRRIIDATCSRGIHSFNDVGRHDKRGRLRAQSSHLEADGALQDAVKGALKRLVL
jgi:hypothetical protein